MPLILGLLVLGGLGAWWFSQMADKTPEPKPVATTPIAKPMPAPVAVPISAATVTATSATNVVTIPQLPRTVPPRLPLVAISP